MKKMSIGVVLAVLFSAQAASAQVYYPTTVPTASNAASGCIAITRDLSTGSKGDEVLKLQRFIVSRNYPGGGNWMLTGYFGSATRAGVINFQIDMRLPQTGILDAQTRAVLTQTTCGYGQNGYNNGACSNSYGGYACQCGWNSAVGQNYFNSCNANIPFGTINPFYPFPSTPAYPTNPSSPTIQNISGPTSINQNTTGTWIVSILNQNTANYSSVSVDWGDALYAPYAQTPQQVYGGGSQSVTFTHAYAMPGTYTIRFTVSNSFGANTSTATVTVASNSTSVAPQIYSIYPSSGPVGTQILISGTGFTGDNVVHFGIGGRTHVTSASGNYIYFTVPSTLSACDVQVIAGYCPQYLQNVTPGQYQVYVSVNGANSNTLTFTVQ